MVVSRVKKQDAAIEMSSHCRLKMTEKSAICIDKRLLETGTKHGATIQNGRTSNFTDLFVRQSSFYHVPLIVRDWTYEAYNIVQNWNFFFKYICPIHL